MLRTFRYPLHPTAAQEAVLVSWLAACCQLYNAALEQRRDAWRKQRASVGYMQQTHELTLLRREMPEWANVPVAVGRSALRRLDHAFAAFFRRCKAGETPGYPRFRSRDRYDSFSVEGRECVTTAGRRGTLAVFRAGEIRFNAYRPLKGEIREVSVRRSARGWWVCVSCDVGPAPAKVAVRSAVGLDLGLTHFAALSDGTLIDAPRFARKAEARLSEHQRALALKKKGSKSRRKQVAVVARAHERVRNSRMDWQRKLAVALFEKHDLIAYEDLNISGMTRWNLGKSIHDAGWAQFIGILNAKAEDAGRYAIAVDPRGTSQRCSQCGAEVRKGLSERVHRCPCGYVADRDINAAQNILALGTSVARAQ